MFLRLYSPSFVTKARKSICLSLFFIFFESKISFAQTIEEIQQHNQDGLEQLQSGKTSNSIQILKETLNNMSEKDHHHQIITRMNLLNAYYHSYQHENIPKEIKIIEQHIHQLPKKQQNTYALEIQVWKGMMEENKGNYKESETILQNTLKQAINSNNIKTQIYAYGNLGLLNCSMGQYSKAQELYMKALNLAEQSRNDASALAILHMRIGETFQSQGEYQKAENSYKQSMELHKQNQHIYGQYASQIALAHLYITSGHWNNAKKIINELQKKLPNIAKQSTQADIYNLMGRMENEEGKFQNAKEHFNKALQLSKANNMNTQHWQSLYYKSKLAYLQGNFHEAQTQYEKILEISPKDNLMLHSQIQVYLDLIQLYNGDLNKGKNNLMNLSHHKEFKEAKPWLASLQHNIALAYLMNGEYNIAKETLNKSLQIHQALNMPKEIAQNYSLMGRIHQDTKNFELAEIFYTKAIDTLPQENHTGANLLIFYNNYGTLLIQNNNIEKGMEYLNKSNDIVENKFKNLYYQSIISNNLSYGYKNTDRTKSLKLKEQASKLAKKNQYKELQ